MASWSLIIKLDSNEHDAVPNSWILSKERCWYPDKSKTTVMKLAKECAPVINEKDWIQLKISVVKKNFDSFDRCMEDAVRLDHGKRTHTASEDEERGRGRRLKFARYSGNASDSSAESLPPKKPLRITHTKPPTQNLNLEFPSYPTTPIKSPPPRRSPRKLTPAKVPSLSRSATAQRSEQQSCKVKRRHFCVFKQGPLTMEAVGRSLCALSRSITVLKDAIEDSHLDIISRLPAKIKAKPSDSVPSTTLQQTEGDIYDKDEEEIEDYSEALSIFPIKTIDDFKSFDEKLKEESYRKQVMKGLVSISTESSFSRCTTSILRLVLDRNLVEEFSWKGQERWNKKKWAFADTIFSKSLIDEMRRKWRDQPRKKLEQCVSSWLSQTPSKLKKANKSTAVEESL